MKKYSSDTTLHIPDTTHHRRRAMQFEKMMEEPKGEVMKCLYPRLEGYY